MSQPTPAQARERAAKQLTAIDALAKIQRILDCVSADDRARVIAFLSSK